MKRLISLLVISFCTKFLVLAQFSGSGSGTDASPYLIFNVTQLSQMSNYCGQSGVVFRLMKDINLSEWISDNYPLQGWVPVGVSTTPFKGKLLGENHTISGFCINRSSNSYIGFFGYLSGATISNLTIEGSNVTGSSNVGAFAGYATGCTITNCHVKLTDGVSSSSGNYVGGFVGFASNCNISNFSVEATVSSIDAFYVGGFSGNISNGSTLSHGEVRGSVMSDKSYIGGLTGTTQTATLTDITVIGNVTGATHVGGFIGRSDGTDNLTNLTYIGDMKGQEDIGGISACLTAGSASTFVSCLSKGVITATGNYVGGIVGESQNQNVAGMENCSHFGDISGASYVGGLVGRIAAPDVVKPTLHIYTIRQSLTRQSSPTISNTYLEKEYYEPIVVGSTTKFNINNCVGIGNIIGEDYIGGLIGYESSSVAYSSTTKRTTFSTSAAPSYSSYTTYYYLFKDDVYINKYDYRDSYGGASISFSYQEYTENETCVILSNSYFNGSVKGKNNIGGLFGYKSGGEIKNNYAYATIEGCQKVGGLVGAIVKSGEICTTTVESNVANIDNIVALDAVGRIYGYRIGAMESARGNLASITTKVVKNGILQDVNDNLQNGRNIGIPALKSSATYCTLGWSFDNDWSQQETESFPYKKYQTAPPSITSTLVSQATTVSGKSMDGGTIHLYYKDNEPISMVCNGNDWSFSTEPLQSGSQIQVYADVEGKTPSYFVKANVDFYGNGTETEPYLIYTADDLQGISNSGHYKIMNDIDLLLWINKNSPNEGWLSIGKNGLDSVYIDGADHKISGYWIDSTKDFCGLFSSLFNGKIKNITIEVASEKGIKGGDFTGILIGRVSNSIIENCTIKGNVEGTLHVGGVAGTIENTILGKTKHIGSIVTSTPNAYAGSMAGQAIGGSVKSCEAQGGINGTLYVGGLIGHVSNVELDSLSYSGTLSSFSDNSCVGGLLGKTDGCLLMGSKAMSAITVAGNSAYVGGAIGYADNGNVSNCMANDSIVSSGKGSYVGGLIGYSNIIVSQACANGLVTATGEDSFAGGLIGYAKNSVSNCFSTANVNGTKYTAGLVAYTHSSIDKCYAKGDISGLLYGAGIVANMDGPSAMTTNCVALNSTLSLTANTAWGCRVIGGFGNFCADPNESNYALNTMEVSLNGFPTKKYDDIVEGISKTQAELAQSATYISMGWDMTQIWNIEENKTYPYLPDVVGTSLVESIILDNDSLQIIVGKHVTIKTKILPMTASYKTLNWSSDNPQVATVENGIVTTVAVGIANIIATSTDGSNINVSCKVTVLPDLENEIAELLELIDKAQKLYDNSTEGDNVGQYAIGARASLLAVIQNVSSLISGTMGEETLAECFLIINEAIQTFENQKITALVSSIEADKEQTTGSVTLSWKANDDSIEYFNIYYSENDQPFVLWMPNTTKRTATFKGQPETSYRFTVTVSNKAGIHEVYDEGKYVTVTFTSMK